MRGLGGTLNHRQTWALGELLVTSSRSYSSAICDIAQLRAKSHAHSKAARFFFSSAKGSPTFAILETQSFSWFIPRLRSDRLNRREEVGGLSEFELDERVIREDLENDFEVRFPEAVPQLVEIRLDSLLVEGTRL